MKNYLNLIFVLLLSSVSINAQSYIPIPLENTFWKHNVGGGEPGCVCNSQYVLYTNGDTLVNNQTYTKFDFYGDIDCPCISPTINFGIIRQDSVARKVYMIEKDSTEEKILYDFSQQVGDTVNSMLSKIFTQQVFLTITSIDSIQIDGIYHKRFNILNSSTQLIEGVGSTRGFLHDFEQFESLCDLICINSNEQTIYPSSSSQCNLALGVKNKEYLNSDNISIFPNPTSTSLNISSSNESFQQIEIFNSIGEKIKIITCEGKNLEINISEIESGFYSIKITRLNGNSFYQKFIKP